MRGKLGKAQLILIKYLCGFITETGHSPRVQDTAEATGIHEGNIGTMLRILHIRDMVNVRSTLLTIENAHGENTRGQGLAVLGIRPAPDEEMIWVKNPDSPFIGMSSQRRCMCCNCFFLSSHKFNRLCKSCNMWADASVGPEYEMGYVSNVAGLMQGKIGGYFTGVRIVPSVVRPPGGGGKVAGIDPKISLLRKANTDAAYSYSIGGVQKQRKRPSLPELKCLAK